MRLNKSTGHAIRIMIECARAEPRLVKVVDLAACLDLSMQNVFKIVHILSRARLVACTRGRNGGVRLARNPEAIRLGDIVRATEATRLAKDDLLPAGDEASSDATDVMHAIELALEAFVDVLDRHTLAAMAGRLPADESAADYGRAPAPLRRVGSRRNASAGASG
ncbi:MAG: Rrf2 family transcriptional regulator [Hyphomicrobiaceae bacterium]